MVELSLSSSHNSSHNNNNNNSTGGRLRRKSQHADRLHVSDDSNDHNNSIHLNDDNNIFDDDHNDEEENNINMTSSSVILPLHQNSLNGLNYHHQGNVTMRSASKNNQHRRNHSSNHNNSNDNIDSNNSDSNNKSIGSKKKKKDKNYNNNNSSSSIMNNDFMNQYYKKYSQNTTHNNNKSSTTPHQQYDMSVNSFLLGGSYYPGKEKQHKRRVGGNSNSSSNHFRYKNKRNNNNILFRIFCSTPNCMAITFFILLFILLYYIIIPMIYGLYIYYMNNYHNTDYHHEQQQQFHNTIYHEQQKQIDKQHQYQLHKQHDPYNYLLMDPSLRTQQQQTQQNQNLQQNLKQKPSSSYTSSFLWNQIKWNENVAMERLKLRSEASNNEDLQQKEQEQQQDGHIHYRLKILKALAPQWYDRHNINSYHNIHIDPELNDNNTKSKNIDHEMISITVPVRNETTDMIHKEEQKQQHENGNITNNKTENDPNHNIPSPRDLQQPIPTSRTTILIDVVNHNYGDINHTTTITKEDANNIDMTKKENIVKTTILTSSDEMPSTIRQKNNQPPSIHQNQQQSPPKRTLETFHMFRHQSQCYQNHMKNKKNMLLSKKKIDFDNNMASNHTNSSMYHHQDDHDHDNDNDLIIIQTTLVLQSTYDRIWILTETCTRWYDPIIAVIALTIEQSNDPNIKLPLISWKNQCPQLTLIFYTLSSIPISSHTNNTNNNDTSKNDTNHNNNHPSESFYPVNELRNIALDAVVTSHVLVMDIDFVPSKNLHEAIKTTLYDLLSRNETIIKATNLTSNSTAEEDVLLSSQNENNVNKDNDNNTAMGRGRILNLDHYNKNNKIAIVIPAFERILYPPCQTDQDCKHHLRQNSSFLPYDFDTLYECYYNHPSNQHQDCIIFQTNNNPDGHSSTNTDLWLEEQIQIMKHQAEMKNSSLPPPTTAKMYPIDCFRSLRYEPYVVIPWCPMTTTDIVDHDNHHSPGNNSITYDNNHDNEDDDDDEYIPISPYYDERFYGYGKNKIQHISHLRFLKYSFYVISSFGFIIHNPHIESKMKEQWNDIYHSSLHKQMDTLYQSYLYELWKKYSNTTTTSSSSNSSASSSIGMDDSSSKQIIKQCKKSNTK